MKKYKFYVDVDYIQGYLRYGHFEGTLTEEQYQEYLSLKDESEKEELLKELGDLIVDDWSVEDYGDLQTPTFTEIENESEG